MESTSELASSLTMSRTKLTFSSKKPTQLTAPAYVEALMTWTQSILDDERHFPQKMGKFPSFHHGVRVLLEKCGG